MIETILTKEMLQNLFEICKQPIEYSPIVLEPTDYEIMKNYGYDMTGYKKIEPIPQLPLQKI